MNKKQNKQSAKFIILTLLMGFFLGVFLGLYVTERLYSDESLNGMGLLTIIIFIFILFYLQLIIHEAGHLIFGLISGYKFSSFRVGQFILIKTNGKFHIKKIKLAGTGGQCLMIPPEPNNGKIPVVLYNLGGVLFNLITSLISMLLSFIFYDYILISTLLMSFSAAGIILALLNGIPMSNGMISNDGFNVLALRKNPKAVHSMYLGFKISEAQTNGIRIKDMPEEWFKIPTDEEMKNVLIASDTVFVCNRLMDEHSFSDAVNLMRSLVYSDNAVVGVYKYLLKTDLIYCELIGEKNPLVLNTLLDKNQKNFMYQMKSNPSVLRTQYAYALLVERDRIKAEKLKRSFDKVSKTFPYTAEITAEKELMDIAKNFAN